MTARRRRYHHGDLRRTLLDASLALIAGEGIGALSLREVARRAEVTHAAPYNHFPDRAALLSAIAEEGFALLLREMQAARTGATNRPDVRLARIGASYVRFAQRHPAHFRVMCRPEVSGKSASLETAGAAAYGLLVDSVAACQRAGLAPRGDPRSLALTAWSTVHGLASLWLDGPLSPMADAKDTAQLPGVLVRLMTAAGQRSRRPAAARRRTVKSSHQAGRAE
jgi:AcrR family transcriptional regulator